MGTGHIIIEQLFFLINRFARLQVILVENQLGHGIRWTIIPTGIIGMSVKADRDYRPCAPIRTAPPFAATPEFHAYSEFFMFHCPTPGRNIRSPNSTEGRLLKVIEYSG